jgi:hypothetical protein
MATASHVYIICPVRNITPAVKQVLDTYVNVLRNLGKVVHYPLDPDSCNQSLDERTICDIHRKAMAKADEVHLWWDPNSKGSLVDFGMALLLSLFKPIKFVLINEREVRRTEAKSYENVLLDLVAECRYRDGEKFHFEPRR